MASRLVAVSLALAALTACAQPETPVPGPPAPSDACGASGLQGLVGKPRSVLNTMMLEQEVRQIGPNMAVTMDYNPGRVNVEYDANDRITEISCY